TAGDVIEYNYRIGTDWENESPEPRRYVVKNGSNLIQNRFGVFTGLEELGRSPISVYPNPSRDGRFTLAGLPPFSRIDLYTASGQFVQAVIGNAQSNTTLDLSDQAHGLYLVKTTAPGGQVYLDKIMFR
ncbi:MAG: T9SS type A sorting domain-containing protein, partial [Bacteroidota bacterium]